MDIEGDGKFLDKALRLLHKENEMYDIDTDCFEAAGVHVGDFSMLNKTFTVVIGTTKYDYYVESENVIKIRIWHTMSMTISFNERGYPVGPNTQYLTTEHRDILRILGPMFIKRVYKILY